jgi:integrase
MRTPKKQKKPATWIKSGECLYRYSGTGAYFALFKVKGIQRRINLETKDLEIAKRKRDEHKIALEDIDFAKQSNALAPLVEEYLELKKTLSFKTRHRLSHVLTKLLEHQDPAHQDPLAKWKVKEITKSTLERFLLTLAGDLSVRTRKEYLRTLKAFFQHLVDDRVLRNAPTASIKITEKAPKIIRNTPGIEEVKQIIEAVRTQPFSDTREEAADLLTFLAGAGIGNAEAAALRAKDINWKAGTIRLHRQKTKTDFQIPIFPAVEEMLKRRHQGKKADEKIFEVGDIKKSLAAACKRLGLPHYSHRAFRRFFITSALDAGANPRAVANWQGHSDTKLVLQVYSEVRGEYSKQESEKVTFTF